MGREGVFSVSLLLLLLPESLAHADISQCGKRKDCLFSPPGCQIENCTYFFSSYSKENWTIIELGTTNLAPNTDYIAVGYSDDDIMGDEAVTYCYLPLDGSTPLLHTSFNHGKSNTPPPDNFTGAEGENVQMLHAHRDGGSLYCTFRQRTFPLVESEFLPVLDNRFTLFVARGHAHNPNKIGIHSLDTSSPDFPFIAASPVSLNHEFTEAPSTLHTSAVPTNAPADQTTPSTTEASQEMFSHETRRWFVRIHGVLMLPVWLFLLPCAVLAARYLRDHFASFTPCGLKFWFHIHRTLNWAGVLLGLLAVLFVFLGKQFRWTGPAYWKTFEKNTSPGTLHSLFGTIATLCSFLQVFLALIRCSPESRGRPVFNVVHKIFGVLAIISAWVCLFFAVNFFLKLWSNQSQPLYLFILYVAGFLISVLLFEILERLKNTQPKQKEEFELSGGGMNGHINEDPYRKRLNQRPMYGTSLLYVLCFLGSLAAAVLLILLLLL